ncbi:uncharacterized protein A4U43_C05F24850 [Asparagus officinalis]|uniref:Uncharacterized protein n=1 Tax=Asparagus officinalis TaxID=4686 RepID=A0A5P1EWT5_ASPOF|nr:protein OSB2, chloroplastic-like isoform X2 [Asparagus officinalis]ONK69617.1 uncharacterized protein A4U43_C05F24850 [Asparagus officinalis]
MSLSRSLSRLLSSSNPQKCPLLRSSSFSAETLTKSPIKRAIKRNPKSSTSDFPRPSEIPFQTKVANSVHLVGSLAVPVQLQTLPSGAFAVSVLVQESTKKGTPQLCIPVIFRGDLAHIAACHLKENDLVYVTGQLSGEALPREVEDNSEKTVESSQSHIQVVANSLSFVQKTSPGKENDTLYDQDNIASDISEETPSNLHLWRDLFDHPEEWWDNRSSKSNRARAAFKHKKSGQQLWINDSTPEWVLSKLDMLGQTPSSGTNNERNNNAKSLWNDLVDNPQQWWDNRGDKLKGLVNGKYPDFKQKDTKKGLWLDTAPDWVLLKLNGLVFGSSNSTTKSEKENLWRDLVENPNKWWDKRSNKIKPIHPDFKHKDTGEALWIGSSTPSWVLPKLPPVVTAQNVDLEKAILQSDTR